LNIFLNDRCLAERARTVQSLFGPFEIAARFAEDTAAALPLPAHRFDPCVIHPAVVVDKYQTVAYDTNRYSVPRPFAFQMVTVKGYVDQVVIVARGQVIARHVRSEARQTMVLDPLHYVAELARKPGALDCAPVFRDWELPACFARFRAELEGLHGMPAGSRRFARVLQLLSEHPLARVRQAVEDCSREQLLSAEAVIQRTRFLGAIAGATGGGVPPSLEATAAAQVHVPLPDLSRFDDLLGVPMLVSQSPIVAINERINMQCEDQSPEGPVGVSFA
jgi:hypothetical protein